MLLTNKRATMCKKTLYIDAGASYLGPLKYRAFKINRKAFCIETGA